MLNILNEVQKTLALVLLLLLSANARGQALVCSDVDRSLYNKKQIEFQELKPNAATLVTDIGRAFLGTSYMAQTLEINEKESLVINFHEFDCTTYVENVLAFSLLVKKQQFNIEAFANLLRNIRYRDGKLSGYGSRLHYFTEWIADNSDKGIIRDITKELGGIAIEKEINFMSGHRDLYPMLKDDSNFEDILTAEKRLNNKSIYYLPREQVKNLEKQLQDGDIIALATSIDGLDVTHTGFAYMNSNGRIHLLHASSSGEVEISEKPLSEYLKGIKSNTGIIVARPL